MGNNPSLLLAQAVVETGESLDDPQIRNFIMKYPPIFETINFNTITKAVAKKYPKMFTVDRNEIQITVEWSFKPEQGKAVWNQMLKTFQTHQWKATHTLILRVLHRYGFEHLRVFTYGLEKAFAHLRRFDLFFHQNGVLLDEDFETLGFQIGRHLRSLKQLNVLFYGHHECSSESRKLFIKQVTSQLFDLEEFTLIFYSAPEQTYQQTNDKDATVISSYIGRHLKKLKRLSLGFAMNAKLTDAGFQAIGYNIGHHLPFLHKLSLKFTGCFEFTGKSYNSIITQIDHDIDPSEYEPLTALSKVRRLTFSLAGVEGISGEIIGKLFEKLTEVKKLTLNLSCSGLNDKGLQAIGTSLTQNMTNLVWSFFYMTECASITDQGLKDFAVALAGHPSLKSMGISFEKSPGVTNECQPMMRQILHYPGSKLLSNLL